MKMTIVGASAIVGMLTMSGCTLIKAKEPEQITVAEVVKEVTEALKEVSRARASLYEKFDSAEIALETVTETEVGGEIKLLVISMNSSVTNSMAQTIYYKLTPPAPELKAAGVNVTIRGALAKAIVKSSEEIEKALQNQKDLALKELSATVRFEVTKSGSAGIEVELTPVTLGGGHSNSKSVSHEITLNFSVPSKT